VGGKTEQEMIEMAKAQSLMEEERHLMEDLEKIREMEHKE
jgi:hypothetical protein